jgi:hypothetical protein
MWHVCRLAEDLQRRHNILPAALPARACDLGLGQALAEPRPDNTTLLKPAYAGTLVTPV